MSFLNGALNSRVKKKELNTPKNGIEEHKQKI